MKNYCRNSQIISKVFVARYETIPILYDKDCMIKTFDKKRCENTFEQVAGSILRWSSKRYDCKEHFMD